MSKLKPEHVYLVYDPKFVRGYSYGFPEAIYVAHTKAESLRAKRMACKHPDKFVVLMVWFADERISCTLTVADLKDALKRKDPWLGCGRFKEE